MKYIEETRRAFEQGDTVYFEGILSHVENLFHDGYKHIKSVPGYEREFRLLEDQKDAKAEIDHWYELAEMHREYETFYRRLSQRRKNPCARICKQIADLRLN